MRPMMNGEEVGGGILMEKQSLAGVKAIWDAWEIHCLILISLFLQVFLFLFAGIRRRSSSLLLRTVLWLAYLSADSVAIFVLGHLAVRASQPRHQLMSLWAPFVLVHLGGQDTITAFSKQDNELWRRHLLGLVIQVAVAGYVVAKASWPDSRLKAAMIIMFLSGCLKYAERTLCLGASSPATLKIQSMRRLSEFTRGLGKPFDVSAVGRNRIIGMRETLDEMLTARPKFDVGVHKSVINDIMSVDAPLNRVGTVLVANQLPVMLKEFHSNAHCYRAYEYVGTCLVHCYQILYTKFPLRMNLHDNFFEVVCCSRRGPFFAFDFTTVFVLSLVLLYPLFHYVSTPIALALFTYSEKEDPLHTHTSRADITVSYILMIAAIALDVSSAIIPFFSDVKLNLPSAILRIIYKIQPPRCTRPWSENLAQYSMINRHIVQDTTGMASIRQWIGRRLGSWGVGLLDVMETPLTKYQGSIKELILKKLLKFGTRKQWEVARSRGHLALQKWIGRHPDRECSERVIKALENSFGLDFPISVLIWHMATDICYYFGDSSTDSDQTKTDKHKHMSRELSNYIMYLVFKCGVVLSANSQLVHDKAHVEISQHLKQDTLREKDAIKKLFEEMKQEQQRSTEVTEPATADDNDAGSNLQELLQTAKALESPVLPRACELALALISINNETDRWKLMVQVWLEKLYYIAPRCGGAFHYEHLSTGGEFITHVLVLMYFLGPFLPPPGAGAS